MPITACFQYRNTVHIPRQDPGFSGLTYHVDKIYITRYIYISEENSTIANMSNSQTPDNHFKNEISSLSVFMS